MRRHIHTILFFSSLVVLLVGAGCSRTKDTNVPIATTPEPQSPPPVISDDRDVEVPVRALGITAGSIVTSPLIVKGEARGLWFFEASFPVDVVNEDGNVLARTAAMTTSNWMTTEFVPFTAILNVRVDRAPMNAVLVLHKDNPSGLPENDASVSIPIRLVEPTVGIKAYFGQPETDPDPAMQCERVLPVTRHVTRTPSVARAALEELLRGPTILETNDGFQTLIPAGVKIQRLEIRDGTAFVDFNGALEREVGGSCRIAGIYAQIIETLKQFPTVDDVVISIDGRTEDILQP